MARCIFCQQSFGANRKRSKEHILPLWLTDVLHGEGLIVQTWTDPNTHETRKWTTKEPDFKARVVCEVCNTGWMSELETEAKPFLTSMIQGRGRELYRHGKETCALWALKTVMMLEHAHPADCRSVPATDYPELYAAKAVLPHVRIWSGANEFGGGVWAQTRRVELDTGENATQGYGSTLCVGHLVFELFRIDIGDWENIKIKGNIESALLLLWPNPGVLRWPPTTVLSRHEVELLGRTIAMAGMHVTR
jgi:hypothetical protein